MTAVLCTSQNRSRRVDAIEEAPREPRPDLRAHESPDSHRLNRGGPSGTLRPWTRCLPRSLIRTMAQANPRWGAPRIHEEEQQELTFQQGQVQFR